MSTTESGADIDPARLIDDRVRLSPRDALIAFAVFLLTCAVFGRATRNGFVQYDDFQYITENPIVNHGITCDGIVSAFSHAHAANWFPLTWISHMIDWHVFGANASGHHAVSVVLHGLNACLVFLVFAYMTGARGPALAAALLFALHPMRVESVAWAASRKDVLSGLFFVLMLGAYARYTRRETKARYALVAILLACGLMAKQTLMTAPLVLVLLDAWPMCRLRLGWCKLAAEKAPLFLLAGVGAFAAFYAQHSAQAAPGFVDLPLRFRAANTAMAFGMYLYKTALPINLSAIYPHAGDTWFPLATGIGLALILALTGFAWSMRKRVPAVPVGWFWFVAMLLPVSGLVQVGSQSYADRFTYLPHIGFFAGISWLAADLSARSALARRLMVLVCGVVLIAFTIGTWRQIGTWRDSITLFEHAVNVDRRNGIAVNNLGRAYIEAGRLPEAETQFRELLAHVPDNVEALNNLAAALLMQNRPAEAADYFQQAVRLAPDDPDTSLNLAIARANMGQTEEAIRITRDVLSRAPDSVKARQMLDMLMRSK